MTFQTKGVKEKGKAPCKTCPIYLEHQDHKYKTIAWLAYPVAAVAIFLAYPWIHQVYVWAVMGLEKVMSAVRILPPSARPGDVPDWVLQSHVEWLIILCIGLLVVSYLLQFVEYAIYEWKI